MSEKFIIIRDTGKPVRDDLTENILAFEARHSAEVWLASMPPWLSKTAVIVPTVTSKIRFKKVGKP